MSERETAVIPASVELVDPLADRRWADLARAHGTLFASPPWLEALSSAYAFDPESWITTGPNGTVTGGLPLVRVGAGRWERLCSLPFSDYSNPIELDGSSWPAISERLDSVGLPIELRCLGHSSAVDDRRLVAEGPPDLWHAITLGADEEEAWANLAGSARRAIRKARSSGVDVRVSTDRASLRAFYELHLGTRKHKYRLLAQPYAFFTALADSFGDDLVLLGAWSGQTLVAGILLLTWADTLYYKFNASSPDALEIRPNDLLMWEALRFGSSRGLDTLDLGRTDSDHESLSRYKSKYADRTGQIHTVRLGDYRRDPMAGRILGPLTELLTRPETPDQITEEAGEVFYHHFA